MQPQQFAGPGCGQRFEKEYINKYRDCLTFYYDGKVHFERFCYGEGACFVFGAWAAMQPDGSLVYRQPLDALATPDALPQKLTGVQGQVLFFDNARWKWEPVAQLAADPANGYSKLKMALRMLRGR